MTNAFLPHGRSPHSRSYQSELAAQHESSMAASLARRLAKAKADGNPTLIALLEAEQRQLHPPLPLIQRALVHSVRWSQALWQRLTAALARPVEISVEQIVGDTGATLWRAYDPATGDTFYAATESEVVDWIETSSQRGVDRQILGLWGWQGRGDVSMPNS